MFDLLETEAEREDYAQWLLVLADNETVYQTIINHPKVDAHVATYVG